MPLQIVCNGCGAIIYEGPLRNPDDLVGLERKCPKCRRMLANSLMRVEVKETRFTEEEIRRLLRGR